MGQSIKFVIAIVKPIRLEDVLETLERHPWSHGDRSQSLWPKGTDGDLSRSPICAEVSARAQD
jgi:hypothetical protein